MATASQPKNQQRTAVIYFGSERETYLHLVQAEDSATFLRFIQQPLQAQLGVEKHKVNCPDRSHYTVHGRRSRYLRLVGGAGHGADLPSPLLWLWGSVHCAAQLHSTLP